MSERKLNSFCCLKSKLFPISVTCLTGMLPNKIKYGHNCWNPFFCLSFWNPFILSHQVVCDKLEQNIQSKKYSIQKIIQKDSGFILFFGTWIKPNQVVLFLLAEYFSKSKILKLSKKAKLFHIDVEMWFIRTIFTVFDWHKFNMNE